MSRDKAPPESEAIRPESPDGALGQIAQVDKFRDLARELEADEDEARFEETVRQIAPKARDEEEAD